MGERGFRVLHSASHIPPRCTGLLGPQRTPCATCPLQGCCANNGLLGPQERRPLFWMVKSIAAYMISCSVSWPKKRVDGSPRESTDYLAAPSHLRHL